MSFRELRSFAETMRLLGYPNLISMESFRTPNVELVADCLFWLIKRYEPSAEIVYEIEREADRVLFFKQICEVALTKGRIKLNIKKLYQSDGNAVQEMLILAGVLKNAMNATEAEEPDHAGLQQMAAQKSVQDVKRVQQLCSDLSSDGSALFFLLEEEISQRPERLRVLSRATEVGEFERRLRDVLSSVGRQVEQLQTTISNLSADETTLEQKIENKKTQLERVQKRLKSLLAVRPAFMEEYEKHERELQSQFVVYLEQYRNLEYLEHELAKFNAAEDAILEEHETRLRVMRERLRKEELNAIRGEAGGGGGGGGGGGSRLRSQRRRPNKDDDGDDEGSSDSGNDHNANRNNRGNPERGLRAHHGGVRVRDGMTDGSSESDSDAADDGDGNGGRVSSDPTRDNPPRPHGALGRNRENPSPDLMLARYASGGVPIGVSNAVGGNGLARGQVPSNSGAFAAAAQAAGDSADSGRGAHGGRSRRDRQGPIGLQGAEHGGGDMATMRSETDENETESGSDINTSDISTDSDSDEESDESSTI